MVPDFKFHVPGAFLHHGTWNGISDQLPPVEGTTVYFPVLVEGVFLSIGDTHALQGLGAGNLKIAEFVDVLHMLVTMHMSPKGPGIVE